MTDPARTAIAVLFLANDEDARRAAISWPLVPTGLSDRATVTAWSHASGVPRTRLRRLAVTLRRHGICREDRTLDPEAARVIQHVAAEALRGPKRRKS